MLRADAGTVRRLAAWVILTASAATPLAPQATDEACAAVTGVTPSCGWQRPEDMEPLPGGRLLLISEYGALNGGVPGRLSTLRAGDGVRAVLYPAATPAPPATPGWGDPACTTAPGAEFSPHGIHHSAIGGAERVLVVNHGGREAVELFELGVADDGGAAALTWRGCVEVPAGTWINDVVGLPGGALAVTNMVARGTAEETLFEAERSRAATGEVRAWSPGDGWRIVPGTAGGLPNGLEVSADGTTLLVNYYFGDAVAAVERASGKVLWRAGVPAPDNSSWAADGRLLVASHRAPLAAVMACGKAAAEYCLLPYQVVALDPASGAAATVLTGGEAPPFGAATVAVEFDGRLYLGAYTGTRMAHVPAPAAP